MEITIPITLNLTYDQIEALSTLGFSEAKSQLGAFSYKIAEIRRALDIISAYRRCIIEHPEKDNTSKFNTIYNQLKRLADIPYDLVQKNEVLRNNFITALHAAEALAVYQYTDEHKQEYLDRIMIAEKLLYVFIKQYKDF